MDKVIVKVTINGVTKIVKNHPQNYTELELAVKAQMKNVDPG
jgi:hypothetical protein